MKRDGDPFPPRKAPREVDRPERSGRPSAAARESRAEARNSSLAAEESSPVSEGGPDRRLSGRLLLPVALGLFAVVTYLLLSPLAFESPPYMNVSEVLRGFLASLLVAVVVVWYLSRRREPPFAPLEAVLSANARTERVRRHAQWFVHMRWVAAVVSLALILIAIFVAEILPRDSLKPLLAWWGILVVANTWFARRLRRVQDFEKEIVFQAALDLAVLTGWLNASGGMENPFYQVYVLHVIIAGILLPKRKALLVTLMACVLVSGLALAEYLGIVPHVTIAVFPHSPAVAGSEAAAPTGHDDEHADEGSNQTHSHEAGTDEGGHAVEGDHVEHAALDPIFVLGRMIPFLATLTLVSYLTTIIADRLRRSEEDLEEAGRTEALERRRLEGVIHSAGIGVVLVDPDLTVRWFSGRAADWLGLTPSSIGRKCDCGDHNDACAALVMETAESGRPMEAETTMTLPRGEVRHFRHATWPVVDAEGRVQQVVKLVEDVTSRKALEAEAVHAGKLSALGKMAAAVAHEINNPLASLSSRITLMERNKDPQFLRESLRILRGQIARIGGIVHTVSQFGRAPTKGRTTWDVNAAVEEALNVVKLDPRAAKTRFDWQPASSPLLVTAVRDQILQAYLNVLINAIEATPEGGRVGVRVFARDDEVLVAVEDSGEGIDEAMEEHLFEPFATTKAQGTGIGLSISQSLVRAHGGRIEVRTERGKGSCFTVVLPEAPRQTILAPQENKASAT